MKTLRVVLTAALAALAAPAFAATAQGSFSVTASVAAKCTFNAGTTLAFGAYDPSAATAATAQTSVTFRCTKGTPYSVTLSTGTNPGLGVGGTTRAMAGGGDFLSYELFTDSGHTYAWASTFAGTPGTANNNMAVSPGATGGATLETVNIYGQIPVGQYVAPASYTDSITVTVNY